MFETTPPQPAPDSIDRADMTDLSDPIASVVAVEISRRIVRRGMTWAEPMISDPVSYTHLTLPTILLV